MLTSAKSRAKSLIARKASLGKGMFGSVPTGISQIYHLKVSSVNSLPSKYALTVATAAKVANNLIFVVKVFICRSQEKNQRIKFEQKADSIKFQKSKIKSRFLSKKRLAGVIKRVPMIVLG